jgi:hypothetical protein
MYSSQFLIFLGACTTVTVFFSLFNESRFRAFRNIGLAAIYIGTLVSLFQVAWKAVLISWATFGIISGVFYYCYELFAMARSEEKLKQRPKLTTILHGLFMWPIMFPEVVEYVLADVGVLKVPITPDSEEQKIDERNDI